MQDPAESMIASMPQFTWPDSRQATMGKVPWSPRALKAGRAAVTQSSIAPVPKVAFASPGCRQACPTREDCWSPTSPAMGGSPGSADAAATTPVESTIRGSIARRDAQLLENLIVPVRGVVEDETGDAGVRGVGDVGGPPREHPSEVALDRPEAQIV